MPGSPLRSMKVVLFGATGMVGAGVLLECLEDSRVESVLVLGRKSCGVTHPKIRDVIRSDFSDYADIGGELEGWNACFFCLGVSAAGMDESKYHLFGPAPDLSCTTPPLLKAYDHHRKCGEGFDRGGGGWV